MLRVIERVTTPAARRDEDAERGRRQRAARGEVQGKDHRGRAVRRRQGIPVAARAGRIRGQHSRHRDRRRARQHGAGIDAAVPRAEGRRSEQPKAPPRIDGSVPTQTYRIEVGHAHGVLPGNIVGAIANEAGIEGRNIGHIDIREDHSYVDLPGAARRNDGQPAGRARARRSDSHPARGFETGQAEVLGQVDAARIAWPEGTWRASPLRGRRKRPYTGGGNRFDKAGEPRPYESRRSESRNYKGTPRFKRDDKQRSAASRAPSAAERPRFERADRARASAASRVRWQARRSAASLAASRSRTASRRSTSARRPAPRAPTRAARRFATSPASYAGRSASGSVPLPSLVSRQALLVEVLAHVLEHVAVHFRLADRAGDETGVHDHAAIADVIDLVALLVVFQPIDALLPAKLVELRTLPLGQRGPGATGSGKHPGERSASASRASTRAAAFLPSSGQSTWSGDVMAVDSAGSSGPVPRCRHPGGDQ